MEKPKCKLLGEDGNVFNIIGRVAGALKKAKMQDKSDEFIKRATKSDSYDAVLVLCHEYVEVF